MRELPIFFELIIKMNLSIVNRSMLQKYIRKRKMHNTSEYIHTYIHKTILEAHSSKAHSFGNKYNVVYNIKYYKLKIKKKGKGFFIIYNTFSYI
jgi:hypothetical protein